MPHISSQPGQSGVDLMEGDDSLFLLMHLSINAGQSNVNKTSFHL